MFEYNANKELIITRRSYKKITTMLGEFGGVFKIMSSMVFVFYGLYSMSKVRNVLGDIIIGEDIGTRNEMKRLLEGRGAGRGGFQTSRQTIRSKLTGRCEAEGEGSIGDQIEEEACEDDPAMEEVVCSLVNKRSRVDDIMRKLSFVDLLEKALLTESERTLLPLVLLKVEQLEMKKKKQTNLIPNRNRLNQQKKKNFYTSSIFNRESRSKSSPASKSAPKRRFKQAYKDLIHNQPKSQLSEILRDHIISHLEGTFRTETELSEVKKICKKIPETSKLPIRKKVSKLGESDRNQPSEDIELEEENTFSISFPNSQLGRRDSRNGKMRRRNSPAKLRNRFSRNFNKTSPPGVQSRPSAFTLRK